MRRFCERAAGSACESFDGRRRHDFQRGVKSDGSFGREDDRCDGGSSMKRVPVALILSLLLLKSENEQITVASEALEPATVRVAAVQAKRRLVDWRIKDPAAALAAVDENLAALEPIIHAAGKRKCDVLAFPEDTLGLLNWYGMNERIAGRVLPEGVSRMLERLGRAAASHRMYLVVCSDSIEADGATYNTAFFLNRDGQQIGRYHKTCPTWSECGARKRGDTLPVAMGRSRVRVTWGSILRSA